MEAERGQGMRRFGVALLLAAITATTLGGVASAGPYDPTLGLGIGGGNQLPGSGLLVFRPGARVPVNGSNWCPNSQISIYLDGAFQGTATTDSNGSWNFSVGLSNTISAGQHMIEAVGLDALCNDVVSRSAAFLVSGGGVASGQAALPFTGSNISVGAMLLVAFVLVGAVALIAGRRRERPAVEEH